MAVLDLRLKLLPLDKNSDWRNEKANGGTSSSISSNPKDPKDSSSSASSSSNSAGAWTVSGAKKHSSNQSNSNNDNANSNTSRSKSNTNTNDSRRSNNDRERHPEWLNDDDEEMTFDDRGQFIPVKVTRLVSVSRYSSRSNQGLFSRS